MIIIKRETEFSNNRSVVLILGKSSSKKSEVYPQISKEFAERFLASEKKFDYVKSEDQYIFLVKEDQKAEELRITGSNIQALIAESIQEISVLGKEKSVIFLAEGIALANYQFNRFLTKAKVNKLQTILVQENVEEEKITELNNTIKSVYWTRNVVNTPVSHLNATQLAEELVGLGKEAGFSVQVLEKTQIESLKMGGLLAVNKGSIDPPTFTIAEYKPKKIKNKKPIVLVGKGVVYDTGGLSLKPTPGSMDTMKSDMAGAAAVAGALYLAALQKLPLHIVALIPATDNRPGENAYAPGDVITMFDGTTVEVLNTDAEGRMILADALAYSGKYSPEIVIDAATLTGAAVRAIGTEASIVMGNAKDSYFESLEKAGSQTHERVVRFPFWDDYKEHMKSKIADLKNIGIANAGMISAGKFLEHFCKSPYIHMDVAGPTWSDTKENYRGFGGTGAGVRLLYEFFKTHYL
jgi:leucyl aminopeptidase